MIELFTGEFTVSPAPLQLSLNWCSHACSYCFANLNKPGRKAKVHELQNQLKNFPNHSSLVAELLRQGYPVLISNLVDPFATSNYQIAVPAIDQLTQLGVPVTIQTRGGRGVDDVLSFLPRSVWYISIPTLDDAVRKRIEPAAPSIPSRFELIQKLQEKGHRVVVGANPMDWIEDYDEYCEAVKKAGVTNVWVGLLHFSHEQARNMPDRSITAIGEERLAEITGKRKHPESQIDNLAAMIEAMENHGITWFSTECLFTTNFFDAYSDVYAKTFPTISQFLQTKARENKGKQHFDLSLEDWMEYALPKCPEGEFHMPGYLFNRDRNTYNKQPDLPKKMGFDTLLRIFWQNPRFSGLPYFREVGSLIEQDSPGEVRYSTDATGALRYRYSFAGNAQEYVLLGQFTQTP